MKSKDGLGDRMKRYENVTRNKLVPRSYTIIRLDGKAFHTYTKGYKKPWDRMITDTMERTMEVLCREIQGVKFGYYQSDEISLVLTDFDELNTNAWFDGNIQKIVSVSASMASAWFNYFWLQNYYSHTDEPDLRYTKSVADHFSVPDFGDIQISVGEIINYRPAPSLAFFDSRTFNLPTKDEVINYFIWRQQDAIRNSISSYAQSKFSHKELHKKSTKDMKEMCVIEGNPWDEVPTHLQRGSGCKKEEYNHKSWERNEDGEMVHHLSLRTRWATDRELPVFTTDRSYLDDIILDINER